MSTEDNEDGELEDLRVTDEVVTLDGSSDDQDLDLGELDDIEELLCFLDLSDLAEVDEEPSRKAVLGYYEKDRCSQETEDEALLPPHVLRVMRRTRRKPEPDDPELRAMSRKFFPKKQYVWMTIVCGLPKSGKSTWISRNCGGLPVVSFDDYFDFASEADFSNKKVQEAVNRMVRDVEEYLKEGESVVVEGSFYNFELRKSFASMAKNHLVKTKLVWIEFDSFWCEERNQNSERPIPSQTMKNIVANCDDPDILEDWDRIMVVDHTETC